jgi:hypothetical protein
MSKSVRQPVKAPNQTLPKQAEDGHEHGAPAQQEASYGNAAASESLNGEQSASTPSLSLVAQQLGVDLSQYTVHTGAKEACEGAGAAAFVEGNQVFFADSSPSVELIAEELSHLAQLDGGTGGSAVDHDGAERQAKDAASAIAAGEQASALGGAPKGTYRNAAPESAMGTIRAASNTIRAQWTSIFNNMQIGINNFETNSNIPSVPDTAGTEVWKYARDEFIKFGLGKAGGLGVVAEHIIGAGNAAQQANANLTTWNGEVSLANFVSNMRDAGSILSTTSETYFNGDGSVGFQSMLSSYNRISEEGQAEWLRQLTTEAQAFNVADVSSSAFETLLYTAWINKNEGTDRTDPLHPVRTGALRVEYDIEGRSISLKSASLRVPGATGILPRLEQLSPISNLAEAPCQKEVWLNDIERNWETLWMGRTRARAFSLYGADNGLVQPGTFGSDLLDSPMAQDALGGDLRQLRIRWSDVTAG